MLINENSKINNTKIDFVTTLINKNVISVIDVRRAAYISISTIRASTSGGIITENISIIL